ALTDNTITNNVSDGIRVVARSYYAGGGFKGDLTQNVTITGNYVNHHDYSGIVVSAFGSSIDTFVQNVLISDNIVNHSEDSDGIRVRTRLYDMDPASTATVNVTLTGNQVSNTGSNGINVSTAVSYATMSQSLVVSTNTLSDIGDDGIDINVDVGSN